MGTFGIEAGKAAINAGSGILGSMWGMATAGINDRRQLRQQDKLNEQAYEINNRMAEENYQREMRKWEATNYGPQMEQMKKAGLNPGLMYGMSGGGGVTAQSSGGQGVAAGHAPSGGGEMGMGMQAAMQMRMMDAQIKVMESQANKNNTDAAFTGGVGTEKAGMEVKSIAQGIESSKAGQVLTEAQTKLANIDATVKGLTMDEAVARIQSEAALAETNSVNAMTEANINRETQLDKIQILHQEAIGAMIRNEVMRSGIKVNEAQINKMAADIAQRAKEINISAQNASTNQKRYELENEIRDVPDSVKLTVETIGDIASMLVRKPRMPQSKTKSEERWDKDGNRTQTDSHEQYNY